MIGWISLTSGAEGSPGNRCSMLMTSSTLDWSQVSSSLSTSVVSLLETLFTFYVVTFTFYTKNYNTTVELTELNLSMVCINDLKSIYFLCEYTA